MSTLIGVRPSGLRRGVGSRASSAAGVCGNIARTRSCWPVITAAVGFADRQAPAEAISLGVVVDEHRGSVFVAVQAIRTRTRMSSGRRPVSMPIWVTTRTSTGSRVSSLAHRMAMISVGTSRPGSPRSGSAGMSPRSMAKSPARPAGDRLILVRPRARIPASTSRTSAADAVAAVTADLADGFHVRQPVEEVLNASSRPNADGVSPRSDRRPRESDSIRSPLILPRTLAAPRPP